jgi:hypothetical protein
MQPVKKVGPKTKLWLISQQYKGDERTVIRLAAERFYELVIDLLNPRIEAATKKLEQITEEARAKIGNIPDEVTAEANKIVAKKIIEIETKPQLRGEPGPPGNSPEPLKPGVDYMTRDESLRYLAELNKQVFTKTETEKLIGTAMSDLFTSIDKLSLSPEAIKKLQKSILDALPIEQIVRAMEALPEKTKLNYDTGLRNKPINSEAPSQRVLHRGTSGQGTQTYHYDLSNLCDGVTRAFEIPINTRVLDVGCTDAPNGRYRPQVDWTVAGTTLTLSNDVAAPTEGATLYILYVA